MAQPVGRGPGATARSESCVVRALPGFGGLACFAGLTLERQGHLEEARLRYMTALHSPVDALYARVARQRLRALAR